MTTPPALFDTDLLARRRLRAERAGPADFLQRVVATEVAERLADVNRRFTAPAVVGPHAALWAETLGLAGARLLPDADRLDLAPGAHDLVVHALGLHWANDPVGQLVQARRALRPDGLLLAALFGGETLAELRAALAERHTTVLLVEADELDDDYVSVWRARASAGPRLHVTSQSLAALCVLDQQGGAVVRGWVL